MFYDMFLDELIYLREEKDVSKDIKPDIFFELNKYEKKEINHFKKGIITILKKETDISRFVNISRNIFSNNEKLYYGKISNNTAYKISNILNIDVRNYNLSLSMHAVKHIEKRHGNPFKEISRGQVAVNTKDFSLIPSIIGNYDELDISNIYYKNKALVFKKEMYNNIYCLVVCISHKKHNLEIKTLYKQKKNSCHCV